VLLEKDRNPSPASGMLSSYSVGLRKRVNDGVAQTLGKIIYGLAC